MPSAGKAAIGIGQGAASGAATGAAFGPWGALIGGGIGAGLGAIGAGQASEQEKELKRQRDKAKKMAVVQALRHRAAQLGTPTASLDLPMETQGIEDRYQAGLEQMNAVGPQDYMGLLTGLSNLGAQAKSWGGSAPQMGGEVARNSDLYGGAQRNTGLVSDDSGILTDPMMRRRR